MDEKKKQGYILRYYLPVKPNFDEDFTEKRFNELLNFCKKTGVEAVMFYVALDPDFYYMPDSATYAISWQKQMLPYVKRLKKAGISYQLNFQNFIGATVAGTDLTQKYDWEYLVDSKGNTTACACPLGKKFRKDAEVRLRVWAETDPDIIWIDDDFRLHGHGSPLLASYKGAAPYDDFYCYCDEHIRLFNERYHVSYDRESLLKEMFQEGEPSWARKAYLEFLSDTMVDTAKWMSNVVHGANPRTKLAQMTSAPSTHAATGRHWGNFLTALSNGKNPVLRPTFGPYQEGDPKGFAYCYAVLSQLKAHVRETYEGRVEYCPEVENTRFTVWSKSTAATSFQLALSAFMGCQDITLSLYDLEGGAFFDEPAYGKMLKKQKPFLDELVGLDLYDAKPLGVMIPTTGESGKNYVCRQGGDFTNLDGRERYIHSYFLKMGIPCRFVNPKELEEGVYVLDAYSANILKDKDLQTILQNSVFMDAGAVEVLLKRGYGADIGVQGVSQRLGNVHAEHIHTFTRKDGTYIRVPSRVPSKAWYTAELNKDVEILSEFRTPDGKAYPATIWYENKNGGKVAIFLAKERWGDGFYTHHRVTFIKDIFARLSPTLPRVDCQSYTLSAFSQKGEDTYFLIANLSTDTMTEYVVNGERIKEKLGVYQTAVFVERNGDIKKIGKTK